MVPLGIGAVTGGILLVELDVADQAGARIAPLDEVMTEDAVCRQAIHQRPLEGIHGIDALADERAIAEQILVNVGNCARVRVDPGIAAEQVGVGRARDTRQADADPWLQDGVTADDASLAGVELCHVQRVSEGADELARDIPR